MSQAEDILLVSQVNLFGRRRAFDTLVRKYQGPVRRLLMGLTAGDRELSADIAQDTFLKAWMYIGTYKATAKFQTWLFSIAYNVFYDYMNLCKKHSHEDIDAKEYFLTTMLRVWRKISTFTVHLRRYVRNNARLSYCFTSKGRSRTT